ncbi:hypothetical protein FBUS_04247 [Fasciolopsis buskii]|uniref:Uncharacterized protein n=1 Tax=Fasciolopsis buskii TaxID=27845 RepID=A0A8E0VKQ0_9TREM|nr:hypothetical protein FBUS_04247 [Fasciolopsis buski]
MAANHLTPEDKEPYRLFVGKQYAQLRQLESELDTHTQRIQQMFQNVVNTIVQHPKLSDRLKVKLGEITSEWDDIRRQMRDRIASMVQMHRGMLVLSRLRLVLFLTNYIILFGFFCSFRSYM